MNGFVAIRRSMIRMIIFTSQHTQTTIIIIIIIVMNIIIELFDL